MSARVFLNRFLWLMTIILIQIAIIVVFAVFLTKYFIFYRIVGGLISITVFVIICSTRKNPSLSLPWFVLLLIFPIVGAVLFVYFGKCRWKTSRKRSSIIRDERTAGIALTENQLFGSISNFCGTATYRGEIKYFENGEKLFNNLKKSLKNAKKYIFLEYFIIETGVLFNEILNILISKKNEGVNVYILYDDLGTINKLPNNFARKMRKLGLNCQKFNKFLPVATLIHNNRDHRKVCVVDGIVAYTGGVNMADEYVGLVKKFGDWKDAGVKIKGVGVSEFVENFCGLYNISAKEKLDVSSFLVSQNSTDKNIYDTSCVNIFSGPSPFYQNAVAENCLLNIIENAKEKLYIATPYLILDYNTQNSLERTVARGVDVKIFVPGIPDKKLVNVVTKSYYNDLIEKGVKIFEYEKGFLHSKNILSDQVAVVGTINFDYRSLNHHFEDAVVFCGGKGVEEVEKDFSKLESISKQIFFKKEKNILKKYATFILKIFSPLL